MSEEAQCPACYEDRILNFSCIGPSLGSAWKTWGQGSVFLFFSFLFLVIFSRSAQTLKSCVGQQLWCLCGLKILRRFLSASRSWSSTWTCVQFSSRTLIVRVAMKHSDKSVCNQKLESAPSVGQDVIYLQSPLFHNSSRSLKSRTFSIYWGREWPSAEVFTSKYWQGPVTYLPEKETWTKIQSFSNWT